MRKTIYEALIERLQQSEAGFMHYGLWNDFKREDAPKPDYATPALLVEFEPVRWRLLRREIREGELKVRLHIVTDAAAGDFAHFELAEQVADAVQTFSGPGFGSLMPLESVTDGSFDDLRDDQECFVTQIIEIPQHLEIDETTILAAIKVNKG